MYLNYIENLYLKLRRPIYLFALPVIAWSQLILAFWVNSEISLD
jgi:hypothetical protein